MAADTILFCTELMGLRVFDTRGRKIGRVRDAALVPLVDANRIDRFLVGGGWAWLKAVGGTAPASCASRTRGSSSTCTTAGKETAGSFAASKLLPGSAAC